MSSLRHRATFVAALLASTLLGACGASRHDAVAARVGGQLITTAMLEHWTKVLMGGQADTAAEGPRAHSLPNRTLSYLIYVRWLEGEAARLEVVPSQTEVHRRLLAYVGRSFPGGEHEFHEFLTATGETLADAETEARAELTASRLRRQASADAPDVTAAEIDSYYEEHPLMFTVPEVRELHLTNRKSAAAAERVIGEVRAGRIFTSRWQLLPTQRPPTLTATNAPEPLARAIYAAKPHVLIGPIRQGPDYNIIEVVRVVPPKRRPLGQVSAAIASRLRAAALQRTLAAAVAAWRVRWSAVTSCQPGYVVQRCRRYSGSRTPEDRLAFD